MAAVLVKFQVGVTNKCGVHVQNIKLSVDTGPLLPKTNNMTVTLATHNPQL